MVRESLLQIGLTNREVDAYLALLELKEALVSEIAEKTKESRSHLYDTLKSLIQKGLVSYVIKNNRKYFRATSPNKISDYLKEKEKVIQEALPKLVKLSKLKLVKPIIEVYEGKEGIKTVLQDIIKTGKEMLDLGSTGRFPELFPYYESIFHKERIKAKVKLRIIYNDDKYGRTRGKEISKLSLTEVKYMPKTSPTTTYIYGNKTAIIIWIKEILTAILIENKEVADAFRSYFEILWKQAKK